MPNKAHSDQLLQDLNVLLEVYGADKNRWPAADRLRLAGLLASNPRAKQALAEAAALDALLNMAPIVSPERERALAQRILAAATAGSPVMPASAPASNVVALPVRKPQQPFLGQPRRQAAAALLAASLVLGIFAGTSTQIASTVDVIADAVGLTTGEPEIALMDGDATPGEEAL